MSSTARLVTCSTQDCPRGCSFLLRKLNCNNFLRCYKTSFALLKLPGRSPVEAVWQAGREKSNRVCSLGSVWAGMRRGNYHLNLEAGETVGGKQHVNDLFG